MTRFEQDVQNYLELEYGKAAESAEPGELYAAVSKAAMRTLRGRWSAAEGKKRACYFSAEFLMGRLIYSNLMNLGLLDECEAFLRGQGVDPAVFEQIEDDALGNGGLGRLAACFLDSAATHGIPLDGYGIRYRYGLFRQRFEDGFQREEPDDWMRFGDPWSVRREREAVQVRFRGQSVWAVPYDMPVIGYGGGTVNTLRLWQAEAVRPFDFARFNAQDYAGAVAERDRAEDLCAVLYPNDDTLEGKRLRLKQQYFFSSASLQSLVGRYVERHGEDFSRFPEEYAIQLNDTHPTVSIPELLRILCGEHLLPFEEAFSIVQRTFAYTNHTVMAEALEKWDVDLFLDLLPEVYPYVVLLQNHLKQALHNRGVNGADQIPYYLIDDGRIHMARLAIFASHSTNGVARLHTEILENQVLREWYAVWPERFNNKTNGITQRRWLALCNPELSTFITERIGDGWLTDLDELRRLEPLAGQPEALERFRQIKREKKRQLCRALKEREGVDLDPDFLFDIQVKRLHEYKRQLLNGLSILDLYFSLKQGALEEFTPTAFLFGAKAAPGYRRAKGVIKFLNEIARLVDSDPQVRDRLRVVFVQNYDVSYAEKLIPAADVSEQISTAGTEASGTSNMKFMLNGAVTLGTYDGANIEIVEQAGEEQNYIFGARVEELSRIAGTYDPRALYEREPRIRRALDTLVDGTLSDGGTGLFRELYDSILTGADWHRPDQYFLLLDFLPYCEAKLRVNRDYRDREGFARKGLLNTARSGKFSSDRTVTQYAREIWGV